MAYPIEVQARALRLIAEVGVNPAARWLGIGESTLRRWRDPELAERQRACSRRVKQRYRGRCECGGETSWPSAAGPPRRCQACVRRAAAERAKVYADLYEQGLSTYAVGRIFGVSGPSVGRALARAGVGLRSRSEAALLAGRRA